MKKRIFTLLLFISLFFIYSSAIAQCTICKRTTEQLGEKPARGFNAGILYLAFTPFAIAGFIGYRWWRKNNSEL